MRVKMGKIILFGLIYVWIINMWKYKQKERVCACLVTQTCLTLCDPMDCSLTGFSVHRISQARILEWVAISSSRESSWPRDQTRISYVSFVAGRFFTNTEPWGKSFYSGRFSLNLQPLGWVFLLWGLPRSVLAFKTDLFLHHDFQWTVSFLKAETVSSHSPLNPQHLPWGLT